MDASRADSDRVVQSGVRIEPHFDYIDIRDKTLATTTEMAESIVENFSKVELRLCHDWASRHPNLMGQASSRQTGPPKAQKSAKKRRCSGDHAYSPTPVDGVPGETSNLNNCSDFP